MAVNEKKVGQCIFAKRTNFTFLSEFTLDCGPPAGPRLRLPCWFVASPPECKLSMRNCDYNLSDDRTRKLACVTGWNGDATAFYHRRWYRKQHFLLALFSADE